MREEGGGIGKREKEEGREVNNRGTAAPHLEILECPVSRQGLALGGLMHLQVRGG